MNDHLSLYVSIYMILSFHLLHFYLSNSELFISVQLFFSLHLFSFFLPLSLFNSLGQFLWSPLLTYSSFFFISTASIAIPLYLYPSLFLTLFLTVSSSLAFSAISFSLTLSLYLSNFFCTLPSLLSHFSVSTVHILQLLLFQLFWIRFFYPFFASYTYSQYVFPTIFAFSFEILFPSFHNV